ncbi:DUF4397 domain-containing protein [Microbacterium chocolatum]|uniref:DUF4397 domain-containing protein n=1 Tax=Microbacterium aurantiacum TaxID=162393 RepID=UPI00338DDAFD
MTKSRSPRRSARTIALSAAAAVVASLALAAPAQAATAETDGAGWLRLGHLSPDTKSVDVRVSALAGGSTEFELESVGYGDVSDYTELPAGSYAVSMVPAGADETTVPVLSSTVTVSDGEAATVAAYGPSDDLQIKAFADDLSTPAAGNARIRLIQASTLTPTVDVETTTGEPIARDARTGTATGYAEIPAGAWELALTGTEASGMADVEVGAGSVTTLFVLDTADGGLTLMPVLDSSAVGDIPVGGVQTGGGGLAALFSAAAPASAFALGAGFPVAKAV